MKNVLEANQMFANDIRQNLKNNQIKLYNLIGSPGSGKTTLLENILPLLLKQHIKVAVIEGDCSTSKDAERISKVGVPVIQINVGNCCHIDANLVSKALDELNYRNFDIIFVENIGNMVCPAEFDIGETCKIAVISTTEGDEKPAKYPLLFHESDAVILTKTDLIPHTNFNLKEFKSNLKLIKSHYSLKQFSIKDENLNELISIFTLPSAI
jgi:hydrogenase nickel incorporation protein HypB